MLSLAFFFFPVILFHPFFPAPACRSVAGAVHRACAAAAPQMGREQSWGPARCGVMLGAGWAVPVPCRAPLCREQGDNKQRRAVPSSLTQAFSSAWSSFCLVLKPVLAAYN